MGCGRGGRARATSGSPPAGQGPSMYLGVAGPPPQGCAQTRRVERGQGGREVFSSGRPRVRASTPPLSAEAQVRGRPHRVQVQRLRSRPLPAVSPRSAAPGCGVWRRRGGPRGPGPAPADLALFKAGCQLHPGEVRFCGAPAPAGSSQRVFRLELGGEQRLHRGLRGGWRGLGG